MSKIIIDDQLRGKALFDFLLGNKDALIAQKRAFPKQADAVSSLPGIYHHKEGGVVKAATGEVPQDATTLRVKVVANAANWCDSHMDVLLPDCWKKSIKERKGMIPHLHDHVHAIDAEVGDVVSIYSQNLSLAELGLRIDGSTQVLIFETDIKKAYNEKVFDKYKAGKIKQHSIALNYVKIELAINDEDSEKEYDFWKKYYKHVINKDVVDERGYFWVVPEIKLLENSAVLFGANELTPTLDVKMNTDDQPPSCTDEQPFDIDKAIQKTKFFN